MTTLPALYHIWRRPVLATGAHKTSAPGSILQAPVAGVWLRISPAPWPRVLTSDSGSPMVTRWTLSGDTGSDTNCDHNASESESVAPKMWWCHGDIRSRLWDSLLLSDERYHQDAGARSQRTGGQSSQLARILVTPSVQERPRIKNRG